jgi:hypothetical protein
MKLIRFKKTLKINIVLPIHSQQPQQPQSLKTYKMVNKIVAIYQLKYKNSSSIYGFGDFLRGCFCLIQICRKNNFEFDCDISNHPLSEYMENQQKNININYNEIYTNSIEIYNNLNIQSNSNFYNEFMNLLKKVNDKIYYTCTNSFPLFQIVNEDVEFIKNKIEPNSYMKLEIIKKMNDLSLCSKQFSVIHIRSGDQCLVNGQLIDVKYATHLFILLKNILDNKNNKYLILSDNNNIKMLFKKYDNCIFDIIPITHLGVNCKLKDDNVKNTLLDFYLMSHSNNIYAITVYEHGTGFSKWCSVIYNIPYHIKILKSETPQSSLPLLIFPKH